MNKIVSELLHLENKENNLLNTLNTIKMKMKKYNKVGNFDVPGNDLTSGLPNSTVSTCETWCENNSNCSGFVFNTDDNYCLPKSNINNKKALSFAELYTKTKIYNYNTIGNYDAPYNDIGATFNTSLNKCKERCNLDNKCVGFVYDQRGICYPKTNISVKYPSTSLKLYSKGLLEEKIIVNQLNNINKKRTKLFNKLDNDYNSLLKEKTNLDDNVLKNITQVKKYISEYNSLNNLKPKIKKRDDQYGYMEETSEELKYSNKKNIIINSILISILAITIFMLIK
jgi:hypothetical protein